MTREEGILARHLADLSRQADQKGIVTYSDFLNLNEQNIFHSLIPELYSGYELSGGYGHAERQMIAFLPDALMFPANHPIACCAIKPVNRRFAEGLSHRDVLGSLMNLGIERGQLGDILVKDDRIYVFCHRRILAFLAEELTRIRHTNVELTVVDASEADIRPEMELCECIVTSNRLDSVVAAVYKLSRSTALELIKKGCVFVNGKEMAGGSYTCKPEEIVSVRGYGRICFLEECGETKKGRLKLKFYRYV